MSSIGGTRRFDFETRSSSLSFSSPVRNRRRPSRSTAKWSKSPSFSPGRGIVATSFNGAFSCAAATKGSEISRVDKTERVRFMRSAPGEECELASRDCCVHQNHADATPCLEERQRDIEILLVKIYSMNGNVQYLKGIFPFRYGDG